MTANPILLYGESDSDISPMVEVLRFFGLSHSGIKASSGNRPDAPDGFFDGQVIIVDCDAVAKAWNGTHLEKGVSILLGASRLFIYNVGTDGRNIGFLRTLTKGAITGIDRLMGAGRLHASDDEDGITGPFAGLDVDVGPAHGGVVFESNGPEGSEPLIRTEMGTFYLRLAIGKCEIFITGAREVPDITEIVDERPLAKDLFPGLAPLAMFIRHCYGVECWHPPAAYGNVILDDPLLMPRYGFVEMGRLADDAEKGDLSVTIAFIPSNRHRSRKAVADMISDHRYLSICVHGCDHTGSEFGGSTDRSSSLAELSMARMREHQAEYDIAFDPVMLFPQGVFSREAMKGLGGHGLISSANSNPFPHGDRSLELMEMMTPSILSYGPVPLFHRRPLYTEIADIALDMLLGRPVLIVSHHQDYAEGNRKVLDLAGNVNALKGTVKWTTLGDLCRRSYLQKRIKDDDIAVRMFSNEIIIENPEFRKVRYHITREISNATGAKVKADGENIEFKSEEGTLHFDIELEPGSRTVVSIFFPFLKIGKGHRFGPIYKLRVLLRRRFSEFRDNRIHTSPRLSRMYSRVRGR